MDRHAAEGRLAMTAPPLGCTDRRKGYQCCSRNPTSSAPTWPMLRSIVVIARSAATWRYRAVARSKPPGSPRRRGRLAMTAPLLGCTDRRQWISVLLTEPDLFGTDLADTPKHRHREERSDVAIQGRRTVPSPLDRHAAEGRLAMTAPLLRRTDRKRGYQCCSRNPASSAPTWPIPRSIAVIARSAATWRSRAVAGCQAPWIATPPRGGSR